MSANARRLIADYWRRTGQPSSAALDAPYHYEVSLLQDMLVRLEVILADEGVADETAERVVRCLLYGAPSVVGAEQRMQEREAMVKALSSQTLTRRLDL